MLANRGISLALARLLEPTKALIPLLLAKDNILFLDAIGRPPRVLPYEFFRSFKVILSVMITAHISR